MGSASAHRSGGDSSKSSRQIACGGTSMGLHRLICPPRPAGSPAGSGLTSLRFPFGLPEGSLSRCTRRPSVQNASDPSTFFDVEGRVGRRRHRDDPLMSLSLHPSGCLTALYVRFAPIPTVHAIAEKIERPFGALFASFPSAFAMAHWLTGSRQATRLAFAWQSTSLRRIIVPTMLIRSPPPAPSPFRCAPGPLLWIGPSHGCHRRSAHRTGAAGTFVRIFAPDAHN